MGENTNSTTFNSENFRLHLASFRRNLSQVLRLYAPGSLVLTSFVIAALGSLPLHAGGGGKAAVITLGGLQTTYTGLPNAVTTTVSPLGLPVTVTYSSSTYPASTLPPTNAGSYAVSATVDPGSITGSAVGTLIIKKAQATVILSDLTATYTSLGQVATVTTIPPGVAVTLTYDASSTLPINVGTHAVRATVSDPNYIGTVMATLTIVPVKAIVTLTPSSLVAVYNHAVVSASATTVPPGLPVFLTYTRNGVLTHPVDVGTYSVTASILSPNGTGSATSTLVITPAPATVTLGNLGAIFNGQPVVPTATTVPANLPVGFTYNGIPNKPPGAVGTYTVVATVANPNYSGSCTGTLIITQPASFAAAPSLPLQEASGAWVSLGINPGGVTTTAYFIFSTDPTFATYAQTPNQYLPNGRSPIVVSAFLGQLQPNATYYYKMVTVSAAGTFTSSVQSFSSLGFTTTMVAATDQAAPGTTISLGTLGSAAIDAHDGAAFYSTLNGTGITTANNAGIWANEGSSTLNLVARTSAAAPGTGGAQWATLSDPVYNDNEDLAFSGSLSISVAVTASTRNGVWASSGGTLGLIARQGSIAPGTGGALFSTFNAVGLCNPTGVLLSATLANSLPQGISLANNAGVWEGSPPSSLTLMLRTGEQTNLGKTIASFTFMPQQPIVNGQTRSFGSATGHLVANVVQTDHSTSIVKVLTPASPITVVTSGDIAADTAGATFASFSNAAINDSDHVAFAASLKAGVGDATNANAAGIWAEDSTGRRRLVARVGQIAPGAGTGAAFIALGDPLYDNNDVVAFYATCHVAGGTVPTATTTGIWCNSGGALTLVARQGGVAPGSPAGVTFASFTQLALDDVDGAIFTAKLSGPGITNANNTGIFAVDATGTLQSIVHTGDVLNGKTITALTFLSSGTPINGQTRSFSSSTGDLVYTATFSDRTQAIFNVVFP